MFTEIHSYAAYGLGIHSTLPLPEFCVAEVGCDVWVRLENPSNGKALPWPTDDQWHVHLGPIEVTLAHRQVGVFHVREGCEVTIAPASNVDERLLQLYVAGTVMAVLLYQRGLLVLHASAVVCDGLVVAFLGEKGWGKSTLAAALYARGHSLLTDDVLALQYTATGDFVALPGLPQFKLWPDAVTAALGDDPDSLPPLVDGYAKRVRRVVGDFSPSPIPVNCILLLSQGPHPQIEALRPQEAAIEFIRHSYPTRLQQPGGANHFRQCAHLARSVPAFRLTRPSSVELLPDVAQLVEDHLRTMAMADGRHRPGILKIATTSQ